MAPKNLLCFSHLRWDFLLQRPQQLLLRFSTDTNVYFMENPVFDARERPYFSYGTRSETLWKLVPHLKPGLTSGQITKCMIQLVDDFFTNADLDKWIFWYYTSSSLSFSKKYNPLLTVFDCMDEVSMFRRCPEEMSILEKKLLEKADLVFTQEDSANAGHKKFHTNVHLFPSADKNSGFTENLSWNNTYAAMSKLIEQETAGKRNQLKLFNMTSYGKPSTMFSKMN
ncbi:hypothetical protein HDF26_002475 [Pedobacter cryoconitis]|uniref:hypothetical protein n=1 Tax=Pedobacter cryoconitis TaxID=188932 RepID=UPI00160A15EA|nr:hypothetical protein [Pedobacter cryoconitis]MBB6272018.1 hypothetical protein [Pedobacter cryoconitis]